AQPTAMEQDGYPPGFQPERRYTVAQYNDAVGFYRNRLPVPGLPPRIEIPSPDEIRRAANIPLTAEVVRAMQRYFIALKEAESSEEGVLELLARHIPLAREHQHAFAAAVHTILDATGEVLAAAAEELAMGAAAGASLAG